MSYDLDFRHFKAVSFDPSEERASLLTPGIDGVSKNKADVQGKSIEITFQRKNDVYQNRTLFLNAIMAEWSETHT